MSEPAGAPIYSIRCRCPDCRTPWLSILPGGKVAVMATHHGRRHINVIALDELLEISRRLEVPTPA